MGCDIHLYPEHRVDGDWKYLYKEEKRKYGGDYEWNENFYGYEGRNYSLFGILAGVRRKDLPQIVPELRGLPKDLSPEVKKEADDWYGDAHSSHWLTLRELVEFDWSRVCETETLVPEIVYKEWDKKGWPEVSCGGVSGPHVQVYTESKYKECGAPPGKELYIQAKWKMPLSEFVGEAFLTMIERLKTVGGPDDARIVFWFDN